MAPLALTATYLLLKSKPKLLEVLVVAAWAQAGTQAGTQAGRRGH
jgi:hypothetical protein